MICLRAFRGTICPHLMRCRLCILGGAAVMWACWVDQACLSIAGCQIRPLALRCTGFSNICKPIYTPFSWCSLNVIIIVAPGPLFPLSKKQQSLHLEQAIMDKMGWEQVLYPVRNISLYSSLIIFFFFSAFSSCLFSVWATKVLWFRFCKTWFGLKSPEKNVREELFCQVKTGLMVCLGLGTKTFSWGWITDHRWRWIDILRKNCQIWSAQKPLSVSRCP